MASINTNLLGLVCALALGVGIPAKATTPHEAYEEAYDNVLDGDWLRDYNDDEGPYVANQQAYVLQSLATMFRATGDDLVNPANELLLWDGSDPSFHDGALPVDEHSSWQIEGLVAA